MELRKSPPEIQSILDLPERPLDAEYDIVKTLSGIRGTWHRLWAALSVQESKVFGDDPEAIAMYEDGVFAIKNEFEEKLGRPMSTVEFDKLKQDAKAHGLAVKNKLSTGI